MDIAVFIVLLAAFIRAATGFGFALVATPLLTLVIDAKSVVMINMFLNSVANIFIIYHTWRHMEMRKVVFLCLGCVLGVLPGAYLLSILQPITVKLAIAVLVIPFSVLLLLGRTHQFRKETFLSITAGFVGGFFGASTSLGGPLVALFLINQGLVKEKFVATITAFFLVSNLLSIVAYSSLGMVTNDLLVKVAILLPTLAIGSYLGIKMLPRINPILFRRIAMSMVSITALVIIVSAVAEL